MFLLGTDHGCSLASVTGIMNVRMPARRHALSGRQIFAGVPAALAKNVQAVGARLRRGDKGGGAQAPMRKRNLLILVAQLPDRIEVAYQFMRTVCWYGCFHQGRFGAAVR